MPSNPETRRQLTATGGLAYRLRALRTTAGLSGSVLAQQIRVDRSKVSKVETGVLWPTETEVRAWAAACGATDQADMLSTMLVDAQAVRPDGWGERLDGGHLNVSRTITTYIAAARRVGWFEVDIIPGLVQTVGYATPVISSALERAGSATDDASESALERYRQGEFLTDTSKTFTIVTTEFALGLRFGFGRDVLAAQLNRLLTVAELPNVTLAVIPANSDIKVVLPNPFAVFDDRVVVEDETGERVLTGGTGGWWDRLEGLVQVAATGQDARRLVVAASEVIA